MAGYRTHFAVVALAATSFLYGCGGGQQDFGGFNRNLGGDIGSPYNNSIASRYGNGSGTRNGVERGTYAMVEASFELSDLPGDPFDYEKVNVTVSVRKPDNGTIELPAFFDGGKTWRVRYTPSAPGAYAVSGVKLNGQSAHEEKLDKKEWNVTGQVQPGFVRIDPGDKTRFLFDSGERYFPVGHNQAWQSDKQPDIPTLFGKMKEAGENWSRVWMCHWDGKNLEWPASGKADKPGALNLEVAKKWDEIVAAGDKTGIYFQLTLQHHGQYSSEKGYKYSNNNNSNWESNPYNVKNGGFLKNPEDFFTDPQARALTRRKLRYIIARWGYSPSILAWELFNEVEGTDAGNGKLWDDIAMWHREMALFIRQQDGYRHLITTSSANGVPLESPVWETVDYVQQHVYSTDLVTALGSAPMTKDGKRLSRPSFYGEFGPQGLKDEAGIALHNGLWASLMSGQSGAAQYWDWDNVERNNLYSHFASLSGFVKASSLSAQGGLNTVPLTVETTQRGPLRFAPGGGWEKATANEFVVGLGGPPTGIERFPSFLQGQGHREMMPKPLTFQVNYTQPGAFVVQIAEVSKGGATLKVSVDGKTTEHAFKAGEKNYAPEEKNAVVSVDVAVGAHTVVVENTGSDWLVVKEFRLTDYAPALAVRTRGNKEYLTAWIYNRAHLDSPATSDTQTEAATGHLMLTGLKAGKYRATWWDTRTGKSLEAVDLTIVSEKTPTSLSTPPIARDAALYVARAGQTTGKKTAARRSDAAPEKPKTVVPQAAVPGTT